MKRSLATHVVCFGLGAVLVWLLASRGQKSIQQAEAKEAPHATVNGDVNGDGSIDISDPVYLLEHLFRSGPDIVPIECPPPGVGGLPATGQTLCYDNAGNATACDSTDFPGQDAFYQAGCPNEGFIDFEDGTVTDTCTRLMWQKTTADVDGNGSIGDEDMITWQAALEYCDALSFAGHNDWRLPNVRELQSIVDYGRFNPAIDPVFEAESTWYWSSTSGSRYPGYAWQVSFADGVVLTYDKGSGSFVRAVRGGL